MLKIKTILLIEILALTFILIGCNQERTESSLSIDENSQQIFELLSSEETGVTFSNNLNDDVKDESKNVLSFEFYYNGAGVATTDFNNDGLLDIFFVSNEEQNKLFINEGNLKFKDITATANVNFGKKWSTGVTTVDINNDGFQDIYVCQSGPNTSPWSDKANLLYINNGDLTFTEKAKEYGLDDTNISTQATFFDYDLDGDLDCFVLNESIYVSIGHSIVFDELKDIKKLERASSNLYRNDNGKFTKVTKEAGMLAWSFGLGVLSSDINQDGYPDVYVANDFSVPDYLYINNKDGTFTESIKEYTNQISFYSMGIDIADINNDGLLDIGVVDMAADDHIRDKTLMAGMSTELFWYYINFRKYHYQYMFNAFQLNNGNNTFSNIANMAGIARSDWSWASLIADFDNDGIKDYYVTNGYKKYARDNDFRIAMEKSRKKNKGVVPFEERQKFYDMMPSIKLSNKLYKNNGNLHFDQMEDIWGTNQESFSNGASYADLDNDGDLDLVVNNVQMDAFIYKNTTSDKSLNNYLKIKLESETPTSNSLVKIYIGDKIQVVEKINTRGYLSAVDDILHFGLGNSSKVDKIEIIWPNRKIQTIKNIKANQLLVVKYDKNNLEKYSPIITNSLFTLEDPKIIGLDYLHIENEYDDFKKQVLLPQKQSNLGPALAVGDVNGDGLEDLFIGGAAGSSGLIYTQTDKGTFVCDYTNQTWALDKDMEDVAAILYDADGDGDNDLYVVSGGSEFDPNSPLLYDRLYINMGKGKFLKVKEGLQEIPVSGSCVKAADFDNDGDLDLFVGGKAIPGRYPYASPSLLLKFDNFKYVNNIQLLQTGTEALGLVTDCEWFDYDQDGDPDLIVVGEWMNPRLFNNNGTNFTEVSDQLGFTDYKGWWSSVISTDIDSDGDLDLVCGNLGLNSKFKASIDKPFKVFSNDFDKNGSCDIILSKEYKGHLVPTRGRQCSSDQLPYIKDKFKSYNDFANASVEDIIGNDGVKNALTLTVTDFASKVFINNGAKGFTAIDLPMEVQKAPINSIIAKDINNDKIIDLIVAGNIFETEVETPRYDAGTGQILIGKGNGQFKSLNPVESGFFANKNCKHINIINRKDDYLIVVANNNGPLQIFKPVNKVDQ